MIFLINEYINLRCTALCFPYTVDRNFFNSLIIHQISTKEVMTVKLLGYLILISVARFLRFYFSFFSLALVSIQTTYETLKTMFDPISNTSKFVTKYSCLFGVCKTVSLECKEMQKNKKKRAGLFQHSWKKKKNINSGWIDLWQLITLTNRHS